MIVLMTAALAAAQPTPAPSEQRSNPMAQAQPKKMDCCDCCKDMAGKHEGHAAHEGHQAR